MAQKVGSGPPQTINAAIQSATTALSDSSNIVNAIALEISGVDSASDPIVMTLSPTAAPSKASSLSNAPSASPSASPSTSPSVFPSGSPSASPSTFPSASPSSLPSASPSDSTSRPSSSPSASPSISPSTPAPTESPTETPADVEAAAATATAAEAVVATAVTTNVVGAVASTAVSSVAGASVATATATSGAAGAMSAASAAAGPAMASLLGGLQTFAIVAKVAKTVEFAAIQRQCQQENEREGTVSPTTSPSMGATASPSAAEASSSSNTHIFVIVFLVAVSIAALVWTKNTDRLKRERENDHGKVIADEGLRKSVAAAIILFLAFAVTIALATAPSDEPEDTEGALRGVETLSDGLSTFNLKMSVGGWMEANKTSDTLAEQETSVEKHLGIATCANHKARRRLRALASNDGRDTEGVVGANPVSYVIGVLDKRMTEFKRNMFWVTVIVAFACLIHIPGVKFARMYLQEQERTNRRRRRRGQPYLGPKKGGARGRTGRRQSVVHRQHAKHEHHHGFAYNALNAVIGGGGAGRSAKDEDTPSLLEKWCNTHPRFLHLGLMLAFQGMCEMTSFVVFDPTGTGTTRAMGALLFLLGPFAFLAYVVRTIQVKVVSQRRAIVICDRKKTNGCPQWCDMPPVASREYSHAKCGYFYNGFIDAYGALFEDFCANGTRVYGMAVLLLTRMVMAVLVGATVAPDEAGSRRQILLLMATLFLLIIYLGTQRPFLVPLANLFELLVALCQAVCVGFNLWLIVEPDADGYHTTLGISMTGAGAAKGMHYLMVAALLFMVLRMVVAALPRWCMFPTKIKRAVPIVKHAVTVAVEVHQEKKKRRKKKKRERTKEEKRERRREKRRERQRRKEKLVGWHDRHSDTTRVDEDGDGELTNENAELKKIREEDDRSDGEPDSEEDEAQNIMEEVAKEVDKRESKRRGEKPNDDNKDKPEDTAAKDEKLVKPPSEEEEEEAPQRPTTTRPSSSGSKKRHKSKKHKKSKRHGSKRRSQKRSRRSNKRRSAKGPRKSKRGDAAGRTQKQLLAMHDGAQPAWVMPLVVTLPDINFSDAVLRSTAGERAALGDQIRAGVWTYLKHRGIDTRSLCAFFTKFAPGHASAVGVSLDLVEYKGGSDVVGVLALCEEAFARYVCEPHVFEKALRNVSWKGVVEEHCALTSVEKLKFVKQYEAAVATGTKTSRRRASARATEMEPRSRGKARRGSVSSLQMTTSRSGNRFEDGVGKPRPTLKSRLTTRRRSITGGSVGGFGAVVTNSRLAHSIAQHGSQHGSDESKKRLELKKKSAKSAILATARLKESARLHEQAERIKKNQKSVRLAHHRASEKHARATSMFAPKKSAAHERNVARSALSHWARKAGEAGLQGSGMHAPGSGHNRHSRKPTLGGGRSGGGSRPRKTKRGRGSRGTVRISTKDAAAIRASLSRKKELFDDAADLDNDGILIDADGDGVYGDEVRNLPPSPPPPSARSRLQAHKGLRRFRGGAQRIVNRQRFIGLTHHHVQRTAAIDTRGTAAHKKLREDRAATERQVQHQGKKNKSTRARQSEIRKKMRQISNAALKREQRRPFGVRGKSFEKIKI